MLSIFSCVYCMSSLEKCLFSSLAHCLIGTFFFFWNWAAGIAFIFLRLILCPLLCLLLFPPNLKAVFSFLWASLVAQRLKHLPAMRETWVRSLDQEDPLEKEMATHSSILAWRIPWTEVPGGLQSMGSQRIGHDWVISLSLFYSFLCCAEAFHFN